MYHFTIPMALMDFVPVVFFGIAAALLQLDLYNKMRCEAFGLFAAGTINIFAAGFLKAMWKLLYAALHPSVQRGKVQVVGCLTSAHSEKTAADHPVGGSIAV